APADHRPERTELSMITTEMLSPRGAVLVCSAAAFLASVAPASADLRQTNLVSDIPGLARVTDPSLVNSWGLASSATSPWWVAAHGTGVSTLYNGNTGAKVPLTVTIPTTAGGMPPSPPTGAVFNNTPGFSLPTGGKALFIFVNEDGAVSAWNGAQGTTAVR